MKLFQQLINEIASVKPTVKYKYGGSTGENETRFHYHTFEVNHPDLKEPSMIDISHPHHNPNKEARVDIHSKSNVMSHDILGHLGTKNVMHVLGRIKHHLPSNIEKLWGKRVTGSRTTNMNQDTVIPIKHVKPISPTRKER